MGFNRFRALGILIKSGMEKGQEFACGSVLGILPCWFVVLYIFGVLAPAMESSLPGGLGQKVVFRGSTSQILGLEFRVTEFYGAIHPEH